MIKETRISFLMNMYENVDLFKEKLLSIGMNVIRMKKIGIDRDTNTEKYYFILQGNAFLIEIFIRAYSLDVNPYAALSFLKK